MAFGKQFRPVRSEAVASFCYDDLGCILRVEFQPGPNFISGGVYDYLDVPSTIVGKLVGSPSFGGFVNKQIKGRYQHRLVAPSVSKPQD
jgi:hypothetical protein